MSPSEAQSVLDQLDPAQAEAVLISLAGVFSGSAAARPGDEVLHLGNANIDAQYRTLVEQIPAVIFMVYLDHGVGEAYVSPHIEALLGFTREEWLEDPIRWYERIHPEDKFRWSAEAADLLLTGRPLHSVYRVIARDGRTVSFHCDAKMVRLPDGRPWFIHGVGFDITDLKRTEAALQNERNFATAILETVGALVVVLDASAKIVRFNRACELITGFPAAEVLGMRLWDLFVDPENGARLRDSFEQLCAGRAVAANEILWTARNGTVRTINWSGTVLSGASGAVDYVILTGIDITDAKRLERTVLEITGQVQRRIGQDLHDGLGQHLTGVAFMSKVLEQQLREKSLPESAEAAKIVSLVNEAINKTRELSRGLLPVLTDERGLMNSLERLALEVEDVFPVACSFECGSPVLVGNGGIATHVYHIAQEAVNNALKHGQPRRITIGLEGDAQASVLTVADDGTGFSQGGTAVGREGMGLQIMRYRAKMAGGELEIQSGAGGGTIVRCTFRTSALEEEVA